MPSIRYMNQTAPFWDFVASLEEQGANHPLFSAASDRDDSRQPAAASPWDGGWGFSSLGPFGPFPHRGRRHGPPHRGAPGPQQHGPPPQEPEAGPSHSDSPPPPDSHQHQHQHDGEHPPPPGPPQHGGTPQPAPPPPSEPGGEHARPRSPHYHHEHHRGPPQGHCRRDGFGGRARGCDRGWGGASPSSNIPMNMTDPFGFGQLAELFQSQLFGDSTTTTTTTTTDDTATDTATDKATATPAKPFTPALDLFDTPTAFHLHLSLPGAKRSDISISWHAEKSALRIAGTLHRPSSPSNAPNTATPPPTTAAETPPPPDTLALAERQVGAFEREVRLGTRANPALVDVEGIVAGMEGGVLRVVVPKVDGEYVEVGWVDVEGV
ncbi:hypothetical protein LTR28_003870 [Elasticomyces elasticus]|nr:hypothetical protein LTR28_003870 [Elasticomyces elasticus]